MRKLSVLLLALLLVGGCLEDDEQENAPPLAKATLENFGTTFEPDTELHFSATGSSDDDGDPLEYYWDFNAADGRSGRDKVGERVTWLYYQEGSYSVTLTASDGEDTDTDTLTVVIREPEGSLEAVITTNDDTETVAHPGDPVTIHFSGEDSTDEEGELVKYEWDYSYDSRDGFQVDDDTGTDTETNHDFETGVYLVALRVTNDQDQTDQTQYSDSIRLLVNFNASETRTIGGGSHTYDLPVVSHGVQSITIRLEYEGNSGSNNLDLFLYNLTGEEVARNDTYDTDNDHQINIISLDADNASDAEWFDEEGELGEWEVEVEHFRSLGSDPEYKLWMDVKYWE